MWTNSTRMTFTEIDTSVWASYRRTVFVMHPNTLARLGRYFDCRFDRTPTDFSLAASSPLNAITGIEVHVRDEIEQDRATGRWMRAGNNNAVEVKSLTIVSPFVEYGLEDFSFLKAAGLIEEEREPLVYEVDEEIWYAGMFDIESAESV